MWVGTFHNIAGRILRRDLDKYQTKDGRKWSNNYVIYDDTDTKTIIKNAIKKFNLDEKIYEVKLVKSIISNAKNKMQDAYVFASSARDYKTEKISEVYYEYEKQLAMKQKTVEMLLSDNCRVDNIIGAQNPYHYRNKVHGVFGRDKKGTVFTGIYQQGTHNIIPVENCLIENETASQILRTLSKLVQSFQLKVYDEDRRTGLFRHALIRVGHATGQILVVLVLSDPVFPSKNNFISALLQTHPEITSIVLNVNQKRTNMILGDKNIVLYGKCYIEDRLCGLTFRISPQSFYQVNSRQTEVLYQKALEFAGLTGKERVIDAYCGI